MVASRCCHNNTRVLPCFSLISTGTCSYGRKCLFLHDKRAFIQDYSIRKYLEHHVNRLLHTYRPLTGARASCVRASSPNGVKESWEEWSASSDDDQSVASVLPEDWVKLPNISAQKDETFYFPTMPLADALPFNGGRQAVESNTGFYNPRLEDGHMEEVSMWRHFLSCDPVNRVLAVHLFHDATQTMSLVTQKPRLTVFCQLSQGKSLC